MRRILTAGALLSLLAPALAGAQPAKRTRVAVLDLRAIGVEAAKAELLSEVALTEAASLPYLEVIGRSDIQAMLGFEKQKKILGCEEDSSCIAEIGGALGVKLVLVGSVGKIGALYRLDLKVLDTSKAGAVRRVGTNVEGAEERMVAAVQSAVRALFADEAKAAGVTPAAPAAPSPGPGAQAAPMPTPVVTYSALPYRRWILGGRLAFATPGGDFDTDVKQSDYIGGQGVFQLEGLYRLTERVGLGGYLSYGAGQPGDFFKDGCDQGLTCSISVVRLGVDVTYEFADPRAKVVPWVGAGLGFEVYDLSIEDDVGGKITASANGFEPLHLQAGIDARFGGQIRLGAFGMFGIARYSSGEVDFTDIGLGSGSGKMDGTTHSYGTFGLRAAVEL